MIISPDLLGIRRENAVLQNPKPRERILTHRIKRAIALVGDFHIGSAVAMVPPEYITQYANRVEGSEGQRRIWQYYMNFCSICDKFEIDMVIILGDILDGSNRKTPARCRTLTDLNDQEDAAKLVLRHLIYPRGDISKEKRILAGLSGSDYHTSRDVDLERSIIQYFDGNHIGALGTIDIDGTNRAINIRHEMTSAQIYNAMVLQRLGMFWKVAEADDSIDKADILAAAHLHTFIHIHVRNQHLIIIPGWKAFEPWGPVTKSYPKTLPKIGGVILFIDDANRIIVHHYPYPTPHILDKTVSL